MNILEKKFGLGSVLSIRIYTKESFKLGEYYNIEYTEETALHKQKQKISNDGSFHENRLSFIVPRNRENLRIWLLDNQEEDFIISFKDAHEQWLQIGEEVAENYCELLIDTDIPSKLANRNEVVFEFRVEQTEPAKFIDEVAGIPLDFTIPEDFRTDATETAKGVVEIATQAELEANTKIGGTGANLVANPKSLANVYQKKSLTENKIWVGNASNIAEEANLPETDLGNRYGNTLFVNPDSANASDAYTRLEALGKPEKPFNTIQAAINASVSQDVLYLMTDVTENISIASTVIHINLNKNTLNGNIDGVTSGLSFSIENGIVNGYIKSPSSLGSFNGKDLEINYGGTGIALNWANGKLYNSKIIANSGTALSRVLAEYCYIEAVTLFLRGVINHSTAICTNLTGSGTTNIIIASHCYLEGNSNHRAGTSKLTHCNIKGNFNAPSSSATAKIIMSNCSVEGTGTYFITATAPSLNSVQIYNCMSNIDFFNNALSWNLQENLNSGFSTNFLI